MSTKNAPVLIGLHGYQRSGKDTIGDYLEQRHGYQQIALAKPIKEGIYALNPYLLSTTGQTRLLQDVVDEYGWEYTKDHPAWGPDYRRLLQRFGTEFGRETLWSDFWLDLAEHNTSDYAHGVVITDVRFENEAAWVRKKGGTLLNVIRPGHGPKGNHTSESPVTCDHTIINDGTVTDLQESVTQLLFPATHPQLTEETNEKEFVI